jgi:hypothetical protein
MICSISGLVLGEFSGYFEDFMVDKVTEFLNYVGEHDIFCMEVIGLYQVYNYISASLPNSSSLSTHVNFDVPKCTNTFQDLKNFYFHCYLFYNRLLV